MNELAFRFDHVSKKYRLVHGRYVSIRDEVARLARSAFLGERKPRDEFWALKDVSFEIAAGETVGLIGPNGAGKTTILKILSRVTVPTTGRVDVRGKVGALIEIGAGFHRDLSGRENVYLNAAILGMRRSEIEAKFDRIVAFAEVGQFIDTPIKYYSAGMRVRLGFAVAAHIDPEILLIDEVLAVGDAAFQAKCLNKLAELKERQKTIMLVSHSMTSILQHSTRVLWIDHGTIRRFGEPEDVVEEYLRAVQAQMASGARYESSKHDTPIRIRGVTVSNGTAGATNVLEYGRAGVIEVAYEVVGPVSDPVIGIVFRDVRGYALGGLTTRLDGVRLDVTRPRGVARLVCSPVVFTRGAYTVSVAIHDDQVTRYLDYRPEAVTFTVDGPSVASRELSGHVIYPHRWEVETTLDD